MDLIVWSTATLAASAPENEVFWRALRGLLILLSAALVLGAAFERMKQSAMVGYLLAGALLGPNAFKLVSQDTTVAAISELGVALLLFSIGLEFSIARLAKLGFRTLIVGSMQVVVTMAATAAIAAIWISVREAVVIGAIVSLSSTACVLRMLQDRAEIDSVHGRHALGILLMQDLAVVPLVLLVEFMGLQSGDGGGAGKVMSELLRTLSLAAVLVSAFFLLCNYVLPWVFRRLQLGSNRELPILLAIATAIGSAWAAHAAGLSPALGAFVAGMLLGGSPFAHQIRADIGVMRTLFVTIFFGSIGMLAEPAWIVQNLPAVLAVVVAFVFGKGIVIWAILRVVRVPHRHAIASGTALAQVGEFSFVLAGVATASGVLTQDHFRLLVAATIITLFLTPLCVGRALVVGEWIENLLCRLNLASPIERSEAAGIAAPAGHVIIVGFGPAGRRVAEALRQSGRKVIICELNSKSARQAQDLGFEGHVGDAGSDEVLDHAHLESAGALVVTLPDHLATIQLVRMARSKAPNLHVVARARYHRYADDIAAAGADAVVDEEDHVGRRLGIEARKWSTESQEIPQ